LSPIAVGSRMPGDPPGFEGHALAFGEEDGALVPVLRCWLKAPFDAEAAAVMAGPAGFGLNRKFGVPLAVFRHGPAEFVSGAPMAARPGEAVRWITGKPGAMWIVLAGMDGAAAALRRFQPHPGFRGAMADAFLGRSFAGKPLPGVAELWRGAEKWLAA